MTQDEKWLARYNEVMKFIEDNKRRPSKYNLEERNAWNWLTFMKAEVLPEQVGIAVPGEAWGTDVLVLTDEQKAQLKSLADKLIA